MSQRRPDDASSSLPHLPNINIISSPSSFTNTPTARPSTSSSSSNRPRTVSVRKDRILNNPPSRTTTARASSSHTRAASRSSNLAQNIPPREITHTRTKSSSLAAATSTRSNRPTPASSVVVVTQSTPTTATTITTARAQRRHTSIITPSSSQQKPASATTVVLQQQQQRPASSHTESPDALKARQPARFSSNGIATSTGPPPSLAYRRNIKMDNRFSPRDTRGMTRENGDRTTTNSSTISHFSRNDSRKEGRERGSSFSTKRSSLRVDNRVNGYDDGGYDPHEVTMRGLEDLQHGGVSIENGELDGGELGSEDVFLNLARSNSVSSHAEGSAYRAERRRSRLTQLTQYRNSLPADTFSASPLRATQTHAASSRALNNSPAPSLLQDGSGWNPNRVSTPPTHYRDRRMSNTSMIDTNPDEGKSLTPRASFSRPLSMLRRERSPSTHTRSYSMAEPIARTRSSLANNVAPRQLHSSPNDNSQQLAAMINRDKAADKAADKADPVTPTRPDSGDNNSADPEDSSSVSTTAPSTMWDELDDLKSRIRRLELTGRIPASGVGSVVSTDRTPTNSNSSGDRPRTATTTVTTVSSSPRNNNNTGVSPGGSGTSGSGSNTHSLLQAALAKSKPVVASEVYKYLEAAAHDAIALSGAVGTTGSPGGPPPAAGSTVSERLVRRRADGVCRSLTELCIALSENRGQGLAVQLPQHYGGRPGSRDVSGARESILGRELGRERERNESVAGGRESMLNREGSYGRDSVVSMLNREGSYGRERSESVVGMLNREGFGRERTESILGNRESMLARDNSFGRESTIGDRLSSRLTSRFAERKGSLASISTSAGFLQSSPRQQLTERERERERDRDREPSPTTPGHLRSRTSMLLKSRPIFADEEDPESYRSPSRATTEHILHRPLRDYVTTTQILTPGSSAALPPRRQYVTAHAAPSNGLPSPVLHQRRFFSSSSERNGGDSGTTSLNSSFDGAPVNERVSAVHAEPEYTTRYRSGSMSRTLNVTPSARRITRLAGGMELDSGAQGGSLGRTPIVGGERERTMRR